MRALKNYLNENCYLTQEQELHISSRHAEASLELISQCLLDPIEVRKSSSNEIGHLYYVIKGNNRYFCVVLKCCIDGNFISTAYTTTKIKSGELIYRKGE